MPEDRQGQRHMAIRCALFPPQLQDSSVTLATDI